MSDPGDGDLHELTVEDEFAGDSDAPMVGAGAALPDDGAGSEELAGPDDMSVRLDPAPEEHHDAAGVGADLSGGLTSTTDITGAGTDTGMTGTSDLEGGDLAVGGDLALSSDLAGTAAGVSDEGGVGGAPRLGGLGGVGGPVDSVGGEIAGDVGNAYDSIGSDPSLAEREVPDLSD